MNLPDPNTPNRPFIEELPVTTMLLPLGAARPVLAMTGQGEIGPVVLWREEEEE